MSSNCFHLDTPLEVKTLGEDGTFVGYGSVFGNIDSDYDVMAKGAFDDSLKARMPKMLVHHDSRMIAGRWTAAKEDDRGLLLEGKFNLDTVLGRETYSQVKHGDLEGLSVGFLTEEAEVNVKTGVRTITKAQLWETSIVTFPANEKAAITAVKSLAGMAGQKSIEIPHWDDMKLKDWERFLREAADLSKTEGTKAMTALKSILLTAEREALQAEVKQNALLKECFDLLNERAKP